MVKKKTEPIVGTGRKPDKLTVQKSKPLFGLWKSDYTLASFKIMDAYLARINSKNPERRTVIFEKGEIERLLGVTEIKKQDLKTRLRNLQQSVDLAKGNSKKIHNVVLFEEAEADQDENGVWQVTLTCTSSAMKYFFNIEDIGYLRYRLRSVINITSRYTYIMFTYLESNRYRKSWEVELEELKEILNCQEDELYKEFKRFNERILKKCHKELTEKTELRYTYESVRKSRKVVAIRFTVETIKDLIQQNDNQIDGQMSIEDYIQNEEDPNEMYAEVLPSEFTPEQVEAIRIIAADKVPIDFVGPLPHEILVVNYLQQKVALMNAVKTKINDKYAYLKRMIEAD